jgi:hypothetical protein
VRVKIIARQGGTALIEWIDADGAYGRALLPLSEINGQPGETVAYDDPASGIPYGEPWQELLMEGGVREKTAWEIANELRRTGIWTLTDLQTNAQTALAAFQRGYGMDVQRLREAARAR